MRVEVIALVAQAPVVVSALKDILIYFKRHGVLLMTVDWKISGIGTFLLGLPQRLIQLTHITSTTVITTRR